MPKKPTLQNMLAEFDASGVKVHPNREFDVRGITTPFPDANLRINRLVADLTDCLIIEDGFTDQRKRDHWYDGMHAKYGELFTPYAPAMHKLRIRWFSAVMSDVRSLNDILRQMAKIHHEDVSVQVDGFAYITQPVQEKIGLVHQMENKLEAYLQRVRMDGRRYC